jgi:hypothetical protein
LILLRDFMSTLTYGWRRIKSLGIRVGGGVRVCYTGGGYGWVDSRSMCHHLMKALKRFGGCVNTPAAANLHTVTLMYLPAI